MNIRKVAGKDVFAVGLGCMNLSHAYGIPPSEQDAITLLNKAFDLGVNHFDTAALYGFGANEKLVGKTIKSFRDQIQLCSKGGMAGVDGKRVIDGRPDTLRKNLEDSLGRLDLDFIDLYYLHRWDKNVPLQESVGVLSDMVAEGKIGSIGLSEVSADSIRLAHEVHPLAAVQSEYSLWSRNPELGALQACEELGINFVAFSPLGRGYLSDTMDSDLNLVDKDIRRGMPRFNEPHWASNVALLEGYRDLAKKTNCSPAQLALSWLLHQSDSLIVIPGTTSLEHLSENITSADIELTEDVLAKLDTLFQPSAISGNRYNPATLDEISTEEF